MADNHSDYHKLVDDQDSAIDDHAHAHAHADAHGRAIEFRMIQAIQRRSRRAALETHRSRP
eukprot:CAMPEP_0119465098 /NCGR_PEP_ID=MMETSP1344-20130328/387_1 /TAXON_ID=236787 /ORGANISM="Florenciella parvula, Strain CCMP2471" /LENGTH=60 /DNA_ID=CAMNT_0007497339 /DNA_START=80 /DNA_END=262 /DNA_ORIENTATION=-